MDELREIYFSGHVQGVGFRVTTREIAGQFAVSGFVRNLSDGRVQMVAEGAAAELDLLEQRVATEMHSNITETTRDVRPATGQFDGFEIRH